MDKFQKCTICGQWDKDPRAIRPCSYSRSAHEWVPMDGPRNDRDMVHYLMNALFLILYTDPVDSEQAKFMKTVAKETLEDVCAIPPDEFIQAAREWQDDRILSSDELE